jgi:hypothetical protein
MKLDEAKVMVLPPKLVEHVLIGLYSPINSHLVKLIGFDFPPELRQHFRRELKTWLRKIQSLRFKPNNRTGSAKFYFDLLFDYPFGGVEIPNMTLIIDEIADDYENACPTKSPEELIAWLRQFHTELAERLHNGEDVLDLIPE